MIAIIKFALNSAMQLFKDDVGVVVPLHSIPLSPEREAYIKKISEQAMQEMIDERDAKLNKPVSNGGW